MSKSADLLKRRQAIVAQGVSFGNSSFAETAEGAIITSVDGKEFIDFAAGIGVMNVGHSHPKVKEALHKQVDLFTHTSFNVMMYESYIELAERLVKLTPGDMAKKVMFLNSGAEAVENAVKIARKYTKRPAIISFARGFHGRTLLTMTMTGKVKPYKYEFGPFAPEVYKAPYHYPYRRPAHMTEEQYEQETIDQFKDLLLHEISPEIIAAVVMESVQGEGGFIVPSKRFVQEVAAFCKEHGILFIADEIQTGFGRTGKMFAMEHYEVVPDLMTIAKSLAAGLPLSGVVGRAEVMDAANPGELGGTYSGNPLGCQAALAVLDIIEEEKLLDRAVQIGETTIAQFNKWQQQFKQVDGVRGLGAMCAFEIVKDKETKEPDGALTKKIIAEANEKGLLIISAGTYGNVVRLLMPLVITDEQLQKGFAILEDVMSQYMTK